MLSVFVAVLQPCAESCFSDRLFVKAMATGSSVLSAEQLAEVMQAVKEGMHEEISSLK